MIALAPFVTSFVMFSVVPQAESIIALDVVRNSKFFSGTVALNICLLRPLEKLFEYCRSILSTLDPSSETAVILSKCSHFKYCQ